MHNAFSYSQSLISELLIVKQNFYLEMNIQFC